jgi:hypothetical protein
VSNSQQSGKQAGHYAAGTAYILYQRQQRRSSKQTMQLLPMFYRTCKSSARKSQRFVSNSHSGQWQVIVQLVHVCMPSLLLWYASWQTSTYGTVSL